MAKTDLIGVTIATHEDPLDNLASPSSNCFCQHIIVVIHSWSILLPINTFVSFGGCAQATKARVLFQKRIQKAQIAFILLWKSDTIAQRITTMHGQREEIVQSIKLYNRLIFCQGPLKFITNFDYGGQRNILVQDVLKDELTVCKFYTFSFIHEVNSTSWDLQEDLLLEILGFLVSLSSILMLILNLIGWWFYGR